MPANASTSSAATGGHGCRGHGCRPLLRSCRGHGCRPLLRSSSAAGHGCRPLLRSRPGAVGPLPDPGHVGQTRRVSRRVARPDSVVQAGPSWIRSQPGPRGRNCTSASASAGARADVDSERPPGQPVETRQNHGGGQPSAEKSTALKPWRTLHRAVSSGRMCRALLQAARLEQRQPSPPANDARATQPCPPSLCGTPPSAISARNPLTKPPTPHRAREPGS